MRFESDVISEKIKRNQTIKKIFVIILYIILIQIILFSLFLILLELGNSHELPSFLNMNLYIVTSESMEPKLSEDDIIVVKKGYTNDEFKVGNIITFVRMDGEIITHRIERIVESELQNAFVTKGDNNSVEDDEIVTQEMIIGKVVYTMPNFGKLVKLLKNKVFFTFCIILLILIVFRDMRIRKRKQERKIVREKYEKKSDFYF